MTTRTYPLPLPEQGDPRFTAALIDDVSRVLREFHGLPSVEGRDFVALGDALHQFLFGEPAAATAPIDAEPPPSPLLKVLADDECRRCPDDRRTPDRVTYLGVRRDETGDRNWWECACSWTWSTPLNGDVS